MKGTSATIGPDGVSATTRVPVGDGGALVLHFFDSDFFKDVEWGANFHFVTPYASVLLWPNYEDSGAVTRVAIPLWLLAFLCLAWPVTSFLVARRRGKGRGFAVEAGGGRPAPGIDPPPRRPDNIPPP